MVSYLGADSGRRLQELVEARDSLAADEKALEDEVEAAEKAVDRRKKPKTIFSVRSTSRAVPAEATTVRQNPRRATPTVPGRPRVVPSTIPRPTDASPRG